MIAILHDCVLCDLYLYLCMTKLHREKLANYGCKLSKLINLFPKCIYQHRSITLTKIQKIDALFSHLRKKKFSKFIDRDDAKSLMGNLSTLLFYLKFNKKTKRKKRKKINNERNKQKYNSQLQNYFSWLVDKDTYKK